MAGGDIGEGGRGRGVWSSAALNMSGGTAGRNSEKCPLQSVSDRIYARALTFENVSSAEYEWKSD